MRSVLNLDVPYYHKGEKVKKTVRIEFISNRVVRDYNVLSEKLNNALTLHGEKAKKLQEIAAIVADKSIKFFDKRKASKELTEELKDIERRIKQADEESILKERFDIITRILDDNGCKDSDLFTLDFWDEKTEVSTSWGFLAKAVMKDVDINSKKKDLLSLTNLY